MSVGATDVGMRRGGNVERKVAIRRAEGAGHEDDDDGINDDEATLLAQDGGAMDAPPMLLCPPATAARIAAYGQRGRAVVVAAGVAWAVYVCVLVFSSVGASHPALGRRASPVPVAVHRVGFGIVFHVCYLMTLFAWHGFHTGNLVTLDVGRNFAASTVLVLLPMCALVLPGASAWGTAAWFAGTLGASSAGVVGLSVAYARHAKFWSLDPLSGWRR